MIVFENNARVLLKIRTVVNNGYVIIRIKFMGFNLFEVKLEKVIFLRIFKPIVEVYNKINDERQ